MTRTFNAFAAPAAVALSLAVCGLASAAERPAPGPLSDQQLDTVTGGSASANGSGGAAGKLAQSDVAVTSQVDATGPAAADATYGSAVGLVTSNATASSGALATASSSLSLSVTLR
jgi:hypothetical protein